MRYQFRSADGAICCDSDNPNYLCDKCKAQLRRSSTGGVRTASQPPPDPYAQATLRAAERAEALSPSSDPDYQPRGTPPDIYAITLAIRQLQAEDARGAVTTPFVTIVRDAHGVPDPYASALAAGRTR